MNRFRIFSLFIIFVGLVFQYSCSNDKIISYDPPEDAIKLKKEMNKNGNLNVTTHILRHHNHLLLLENPEGQINSTKITDETLKIILDWILTEL